MSLESQVIVLFAATNGYSDQIPLDRMKAWETDLVRHMETSHPEIGKDIAEKKRITDETMGSLRQAIETFNATWL